MKRIFSRFFLWLKEKEDRETIKRRQLILKIFLYAFLVICIVIQFLIFILDWWNWKSSGKLTMTHLTPLIILFLILALIKLVNSGKSYLAASIFLATLMVAAIQTTIKWGVDLPQNIALYSLIIIMSGAIIRPSFAIKVSIFISVVLSVMLTLQIKGIITPEIDWRSKPVAVIDFVAMIALYIIMAVISWMFSNEIIKGLKRAWKSEKQALKLAAELQKERDGLEIKVEKRTQELRESQLRELTKINNLAEFGKLSAGLLHDIKNPLTVISLNLDSLRNSPKSKTEELVNRSLLAAKMAETIIKSSQKQLIEEEDKQEFDVTTEIKNTLVLAQYKAERERIKIVFNENKRIMITSYPAKFSRVIANLVMNAIDAFEEIERKEKLIKIETIKDSKNIVIRIEDNGCGIRDEDKKKLFQPLFSRKKTKDRMGLGLYGSKKIIQDYFGGEINFESTWGKGSVFSVVIPKK